MTFWLSIKALLPSKIIQLFRFLFQIHILQISLWDFNNSALKIFNFFKLYAWFLLFNIFLLLLCFFLIHFCSLSLAFFQFRQLYHCSHSASFNMLLSLLFLPFFTFFYILLRPFARLCYLLKIIQFFRFLFSNSHSSNLFLLSYLLSAFETTFSWDVFLHLKCLFFIIIVGIFVFCIWCYFNTTFSW